MPWQVVLEVNRVLKPGARFFVATHPTWPPHELPWDFWRFGAEAFRVLFNRETGFELERCDEGLPCSIIPHGSADASVARHPANLGVSAIARKVRPASSDLRWLRDAEKLLGTLYPSPSSEVT
jgi:hypothetical protein